MESTYYYVPSVMPRKGTRSQCIMVFSLILRWCIKLNQNPSYLCTLGPPFDVVQSSGRSLTLTLSLP